jgi:hypothetical protein
VVRMGPRDGKPSRGTAEVSSGCIPARLVENVDQRHWRRRDNVTLFQGFACY